MIIVRFTSGLGNQMFQYNLYSFLRERYPKAQVRADVTWFYTDDEHHGFELRRIFENVPGSKFRLDEATTKEIYSVSGQIPTPIKGPLARGIKFLLGPVNRKLREAGKIEKSGRTFDALSEKISYEELCSLDPGKNYYIFGFFIEEDYYRDRVDKLKQELVFPPLTGENKSLADKMEKENSVSIHVRRGDYLSQTYAGRFLCLERDYYEEAVRIIKEKIENPVFYIFSEDEEYVKREFAWLDNKTIVNINKGNDSFRDMQLMSKCKANIIANSTFSQLAAILNDNPGHITVYPAKYMADEETEVRTMPGWIRV
ncbi:MAG: alpha-1,2-fucosyltransferase [Lachnospiraceae bacterium]|nr:alpha-1,2-fucosyltransferase [Lachnospiraceae bacterium]